MHKEAKEKRLQHLQWLRENRLAMMEQEDENSEPDEDPPSIPIEDPPHINIPLKPIEEPQPVFTMIETRSLEEQQKWTDQLLFIKQEREVQE